MTERDGEIVESAEAMFARHGVPEDATLVWDSDGARFEQQVGHFTVVTPVVPPKAGDEQ